MRHDPPPRAVMPLHLRRMRPPLTSITGLTPARIYQIRDGRKMNGFGVEVIQVIRTNLEKRGTGRVESDPVRRIDQYWSMDGTLLWEVDPCPPEDGRR